MKNDFQQKVKEFMDENKMNNPVEYRMLDLVDEIGEVAKEICKMSKYGTEKPTFREEIKTELGDAFYSLTTVANYYEVDLLEADCFYDMRSNRILSARQHPDSLNHIWSRVLNFCRTK